MRAVALWPDTPAEAYMATWVVIRTVSEYLDDHDRARGVQPNPEWFDAFVPGEPHLGGCGAYRLSMIYDHMRLLGLRRLDPEADDHDRLIERWVP
jgi:hypothetical protein